MKVVSTTNATLTQLKIFCSIKFYQVVCKFSVDVASFRSRQLNSGSMAAAILVLRPFLPKQGFPLTTAFAPFSMSLSLPCRGRNSKPLRRQFPKFRMFCRKFLLRHMPRSAMFGKQPTRSILFSAWNKFTWNVKLFLLSLSLYLFPVRFRSGFCLEMKCDIVTLLTHRHIIIQSRDLCIWRVLFSEHSWQYDFITQFLLNNYYLSYVRRNVTNKSSKG